MLDCTIFCDSLPRGEEKCHIDATVPLIVALPGLLNQLRLHDFDREIVNAHDYTLFLLENSTRRCTMQIDLSHSLESQGVQSGASLYLLTRGVKRSSDGAAPVPPPADQLSGPVQRNTCEENAPPASLGPVEPYRTLDGEDQTRTLSLFKSAGGKGRSSSVLRRMPHSIGAAPLSRVQLDPEMEIIEPSSPPASELSVVPSPEMMNSAVVQALADIGAEFCPHLRSMFQHLGALILTRLPKDPEQCIMDHLHSKLLHDSQIGLNNHLFSPKYEDVKPQDNTQEEVSIGKDSVINETSLLRSNKQPHDRENLTTPTLAPLVLQSSGIKSIAERLAAVIPRGPGRQLLENLAKLLLDVKPGDPEEYLCTRLQGRCFSEEVVANNAIMHTVSEVLLASPIGSIELLLLKEIPMDSPGYVVALNVVSLLFCKKPSNPVNYLFDHFMHRCRSSMVLSAPSSTRRPIEIDSANSVSQNLGGSYTEDVADDGDLEPPLGVEREVCVNNFLNVIRRRCQDEPVPCSGHELRRSSVPSLGRSRDGRSGPRTQMVHMKEISTQTSLFPETAATYSPELTNTSGVDAKLPTAFVNYSYRTKTIPTFPANSSLGNVDKGARASSGPGKSRGFVPLKLSFASDVPPESVSSPLTKHSTVPVKATMQAPIASFAQYVRSNSPHATLLAEEQAMVCAELDQLRTCGELRRERVRHEIETLRHEKEYRENLARLYNNREPESSLAQVATEALFHAERYLTFLQTQDHELWRMMQRQLRTVYLSMASQTNPTHTNFSPTQPSPSCYPVQSPRPSGPFVLPSGSSQTTYQSDQTVPTELEILKKRVELLTMEQARTRAVLTGDSNHTFTGIYN